MPYFALLDDAVANRAVYYSGYRESRILTADELPLLDACLRDGWARGWHALVYADYEFGLPLQKLPSARSGSLKLHWFAEKRAIDDAESWLAAQDNNGICAVSTPEADTEEADYLQAVRDIQAAIARGEVYQINYTVRLHLRAYGSPLSLYRRLRQPVPYAALCHLPDDNGAERWTLCFSPELFLRIRSDGTVLTEPMKGTAPFLGDGGDEARAAALRADTKNRAENVMIVDLLRNDLGKIAEVGGVCVPEPFRVRRFGSVWQMTSEIEARIAPQTTMAQVFQAAFPCGSITGAPKRMSMQLIESLERTPRGIYTGSIGCLNPCATGLGYEGVLNVVIRTLELQPDGEGAYRGVYGVGSGIVTDSVPEDEYRECGWKARFLRELRPSFGLIETLRADDGNAPLWAAHCRRLAHSARCLNIPLPSVWQAQIAAAVAALPSGSQRVRVAVQPSGSIECTAQPYVPLNGAQWAVFGENLLPRRDPLRRFKTTYRTVFDAAWRQAERLGAFDTLLFNEDGILLEGGRSSVFVRLGGQWFTPHESLDILDGVMRCEILAQPQRYLNTDRVVQTQLSREQVVAADEVVLCNALHGIIPVCGFRQHRD